MRKHLDRYSEFRSDNGFRPIPFIKIPKSSTDKSVVYDTNSRLDKISQDYYGSPFFGWLILQANPHVGSLEFNIKNNEVLTVPFPLENALERYITTTKEYKRLNG